MDQVIFLDLEDTIIDEWSTAQIINAPKIRKFLRGQQHTDPIGIFSFAIYDDVDRMFFYSNMKQMIEDILGTYISHRMIPTMEEVIKVASYEKRIAPPMSERDFYDFYDKRSAFEVYCSSTSSFLDKKCILVDDAVVNSRLILDDREIVTLNVDELI